MPIYGLTVSLGQNSEPNIPQLGSLLRFSQDQSQGVSLPGPLSEGAGVRISCWQNSVLFSVQMDVYVASLACHLRVVLSFQRLLHSSACGSSIFKASNSMWNLPQALNLCLPLPLILIAWILKDFKWYWIYQ